MLRIKKNKSNKINLLSCLLLMSCFVESARAQIVFSNSDISREIEKNLLFDKSTQEKFDVYNNEYGENLVDKPRWERLQLKMKRKKNILQKK